jgi:ubiquinone/menaquinone biosynthesis C-methylase UbiE
MGFGGWLFATMYDRILAGTEKAGLRDRRARLLESARGDVLEIGAGTGLNLPFYGPSVATLTVTEPEAPMARRLAKRLRKQSRTVSLVEAGAEQLPLADDRFDTVVSTLVLCTVADPLRALREIRRVLKPGGQLLFLEHVRSEDPGLAKWQDRLNGLNRVVAHGCNCNRSTLDTIEQAGFTIRSLEKTVLPKAPPFVRPLVIGTAIKALH